MSQAQESATDTTDIKVWESFDEAYEKFVQRHPMLGLGSGLWATTNLRRNFGDRLMLSGAVVRLPNRKWIAHREKFGPALFALLTQASAEIIEGAKARQTGAQA